MKRTIGKTEGSTAWFALVLVVAATTILMTATTTVEASCAQTPAQLKAARKTAIYQYMHRTNGNFSQYMDACERYYVDDSSLIIRGVGAYTGKSVVEEYGYVLFLGIDGVLSVGLGMDPDNASLTWTTSTEGAAAGDANDTVTFKVNLIFYHTQIPGTGQWALVIGGLRNTETLRFVPCSDAIEVDYSVQDADVLPLYLSSHATITAAALCDKIMTRCTGANAAYASTTECVAFMTALANSTDSRTACPYALSSNTTSCRDYHADNAWADPVTHCPHTIPGSMTCMDECMPTCASCPTNGHCTVVYPSIAADSAVYSCDCNVGYTVTARDPLTGAATQCSPATCSAAWQCNGAAPASQCDSTTGRCGCKSTFTWNATTGACDCVGGTTYWTVGSSTKVQPPVCVPEGRCLDRYQCGAQQWNRVQCSATIPPNILSSFNSCLCNAGFEGGFEYPCTCPYGDSAVQWSNVIQGEVCLAPGQCSDDWQCGGNGRRCALPTNATTGKPTGPIGTCV